MAPSDMRWLTLAVAARQAVTTLEHDFPQHFEELCRKLRVAAATIHLCQLTDPLDLAASSVIDWLLSRGKSLDEAKQTPVVDVLNALRGDDYGNAAQGDVEAEDEGKPAIEVPTPHEQLLKWAQVTLGKSKEGTLLELIVVQGVTDKSKLRDSLGYGDSDNLAFNTLLGTVNRKLKQGKKSRKLDAFYWLAGNNRECVKLLIGDDAKECHAR